MKTWIQNHRDPKYRLKNSSLHYFLWDHNPWDEVEDTFVFLSILKDGMDPLLLNLLEMWCCLVLQTLPRKSLIAYLPKAMVSPNAGMHLNIALPLHQSSICDDVDTCEILGNYHSDDPLTQQYYSSLRRNFYDMKYSPNQLLREYYLDTQKNSRLKSNKTKRENTASAMLRGVAA